MIPKHQPADIEFTEMVHVALKLRGDILAHPKHTGFIVTEDEMIECVPSNLFMFIRLMFGEGGRVSMKEVRKNHRTST